MPEPALFECLPQLKGRVAFTLLGQWPTPLEPMRIKGFEGRDLFVKREDMSSPIYGGNKIRTLETLLALALQRGARTVWSTGAYGSNHALAAALHAPRLGLAPAALLFPQPPTLTAADNLARLISLGVRLSALRTIALFPLRLAALYVSRGQFVMLPGGAVAVGALGHVGAALELARQVRAANAPWPRHLIVPAGSICTVAGLLAGIAAARAMNLWAGPTPRMHAIRVTPWPVTAKARITRLARRTASLLARLGAPGGNLAETCSLLEVHGRYLGPGYGKPLERGQAVINEFGSTLPFPLESTYSAKAAAGLMDLLPQLDGAVVFWSTKSSAPLPPLDPSRLELAPAHVQRWLARAGLRTK
ncbi:pyridoxal-phosphate dependent enzyme [bacterium]|nr:MAG: pyridoxal-phosphate dependent enzyme [bacterium]RIK60795.1 MAG: hypothetical protein DCC64_14090 [Planctomycetota bacterium]